MILAYEPRRPVSSNWIGKSCALDGRPRNLSTQQRPSRSALLPGEQVLASGRDQLARRAANEVSRCSREECADASISWTSALLRTPTRICTKRHGLLADWWPRSASRRVPLEKCATARRYSRPAQAASLIGKRSSPARPAYSPAF